jgi:hypothetical protein
VRQRLLQHGDRLTRLTALDGQQGQAQGGLREVGIGGQGSPVKGHGLLGAAGPFFHPAEAHLRAAEVG